MDIWRLLGHAKKSFYHSPNPIELISRDGERTNLLELCKDTTPPCRLNPFLFNGHLQTFWTATKSRDILIYYKRKIFEAENPSFVGTFAVDFVVSPYQGNDEALPPRTTFYSETEIGEIGSIDSKPMLVALHGLSGGSHETYLRAVMHAIMEEGWEALVVNSRGCAKSTITSGMLYNARSTWDIRQIVKWLRKRFPNRPLFGIGFSLGANILVNYLGEEGSNCLLKAAVVCSNPWNLEAGSLALQRSWLGLEVYSKTMGSNMRDLFETHVEEISKNSRIDIAKLRKAKYLHEFDRDFQGPCWGYPTEGAYYRDASSCDSLLAVRTPLFAIHAEDDPIVVMEALPLQEFAQNPFAVLCTTSLGGHLSWFEFGGGRWFAKPAAKFLTRMATITDSSLAEQISGKNTLIDIESDDPAQFFGPMRRKLQVHLDV